MSDCNCDYTPPELLPCLHCRKRRSLLAPDDKDADHRYHLRRWYQEEHPSWPVALIDRIIDLPGALREYRFVPDNWSSPRAYHRILRIEALEYPDVVNEMRTTMAVYTHPVSWGPEPLTGAPYVARVDYHATERPVLVCIGGIR